ncbi:MAG: helix-turn-helix domain-containing protein [Acidimicrobiales bacterium]
MTSSQSLAVARRLASDGTARRLRLAAGLSLYDVARDLGVRAGTVSRWETAKRVPRGEAAVRYSVLLGELFEVVEAM